MRIDECLRQPGTGLDGAPRGVYVYHVADNEWTMHECAVGRARAVTVERRSAVG